MDNGKDSAKKDTEKDKPEKVQEAPEPEPVVTHHEITVNRKTLRYTATAGRLPIQNEKGEIEARLFYIAYALETDTPLYERPLMFSFNGGPGSSSVWLHMGVIGPKRVPMNPDGSLPPPPYRLTENEFSWLEATDLVFIDPVGTGYSRAKDEETTKKFWKVEGDIECIGEFIRLYLTRAQRWVSPLYLVGESYGTTRAAGLAGHLIEKGIAFNGILLVSMVLHFQTIRFAAGNDLPYPLFLPTYAATAWYHQKLPADLQKKEVADFLREVEEFALGEYTLALAQGDRLDDTRRRRIARRLARYTGLSETYIERCDLRIEIMRFIKELLRERGVTVGRLDSRLTARESRNAEATPEFDPAMAAIRPPYTAAFNNYIRRELGYESDLPYEILGGLYGKWDWGQGNNYTDTATYLRQALAKNPHLQVLVASGYYDLATPYFATEYTLAHLGIAPDLRGNISTTYYPAGHMMYIEENSLRQMQTDAITFVQRTKGTSE
ncbi:MAG: peptidase S10 [Armatimonadaceae bacterium]